MEPKRLFHQMQMSPQVLKLRQLLKAYGRSILISLFLFVSAVLISFVSIVSWTYFNTSAPSMNKDDQFVKEQKQFLKSSHNIEIEEKNLKGHFQETQRPLFANLKSSELNFDELMNTNVVNSDLMSEDGVDNEQDTSEMMSPGEFRDSNFDAEGGTGNDQIEFLPKTLTAKHLIETNGKSDKNGDSSEEIIQPMTIYKVESAIKDGSVCLDGSPPAYYHRPGVGLNDRSWIIHFNGGAWCFDRKACIERSRSSLGSTKKLPKSPPIIQGINSPNPDVNPDFYDWNLVWVVYCDGASFTGNLERPIISSNGDTVYMRGKRVIDAIINDLLVNLNFRNAESIILTGSSAGSLAAIFQADYVASKFPKNVAIKVLVDGGYFVDTQPIGGKSLTNMFQKIFDMQNSSAGLNQECIQRFFKEPWKCFLPAVATHFVKTPIYYLNSAYDIWPLIYFLGIDCKFPSLNEQGRKKRSLSNRKSHEKSSFNTYLYRGDNSMDKLSFQRRDISGFEMRPFFRDTNVNTIQKTVKKLVLGTEIARIFSNHTIDNDGRRSEIENITELFNNPQFYPNNTNLMDQEIKDKNNSLKSKTSIVTNTSSTNIDSIKNLQKPNTTENSKRFKKNKIVKPNQGIFMNKPESRLSISDEKNKELQQQTLHSTLYKSLSDLNIQNTKQRHLKPFHKTVGKVDILSTNIKTFEQLKTLNLVPTFDNSSKPQESGNFINLPKEKKGSKRHDTFKRRRSTSIAREYIKMLRSDPPECTEEEINDALKYRDLILRDMDQSMVPKSSGRFLVSCLDHSMSLFDETWTGMKIRGKSIQQAFGEWFFNRVPKEKSNLIDCPYPCNQSCP